MISLFAVEETVAEDVFDVYVWWDLGGGCFEVEEAARCCYEEEEDWVVGHDDYLFAKGK